MKLSDINLNEESLSRLDKEVLDSIRQSVDGLNAYKLGNMGSIDPGFAEAMGMTVAELEHDRQAKIDLSLKVLDRAFAIAKPCQKTLFRGVESFDNVERRQMRYLSATESLDIAQDYGRKLIKILPGTITLDFDDAIGFQDQVFHHLFNTGQGFEIVSQEADVITLRGL